MDNTDYESLVKQVCACKDCHKIPSSKGTRVEGCPNQDCVNLWNYWQGDINAKIVLIGQDFGNLEEGIADPNGAREYDLEDNKLRKPWIYKKDGSPVDDAFIKKNWSKTDKRLRELFQKIFKIDISKIQKLYFTNMSLCYRTGHTSGNADFNNKWINKCAQKFLLDLLRIIKPDVVIVLGKKAFDAFAKCKDNNGCKFLNSSYAAVQNVKGYARIVEGSHSVDVDGKEIKVYPVYHTAYSSRNRGQANEEKDWQRIANEMDQVTLKELQDFAK